MHHRLARTVVTAFTLGCVAFPLAAQGTIRWEPFELPASARGITAQLGRLDVPLVRGEAGSGTATLAFVRLQATKRGTAAPIVYLAGGPGQSAIPAARSAYAIPSLTALAEVGDVILLDQRGVGMSTPRPTCPGTAVSPGERFVSARAEIARNVLAARRCVAEWSAKGVPARAFTNKENAADVDDIRKALGASKVSLYGFSYGTHLGTAVLRYFGENVERAALLGTAGPTDMRKLPWTADAQIEKVSLLAARDPAIGRDVPDMAGLLRRVLAKLTAQPMIVTIMDRQAKQEIKVPIDADALRSILLFDLGDGNDLPVFPALLLTIDRGDPSILAWFVDKRYSGTTGGANLMYLGMRCSASASPARDRQIALEAETSMLGNVANLSYTTEVCAELPGVDLGDAYRAPLVTDVPVLFISGTLDNNTPPFQAEQLRWAMPRATHLVVLNAGHEDTQPMEAVQRTLVDFFAGKDVSDRRLVHPPLKFLSVEDAKKDRPQPR